MTAELVVVKGKDRGAFLAIDKEKPLTIGRSDECDLRLRGDKKVSTSHARVTTVGERILLEDLGSTNGTYVNGERVSSVPLRSGDRVKIGHTLLVFRTDSSSVHLSDLDVKDSSQSVKKDSSSSGTRPPDHAAQKDMAAALLSLGDVLGEPSLELKPILEHALRLIVQVTGASRAMTFLRDPDGGALGCACALGGRDPGRDNAPVDGEVLRIAVAGEQIGPQGDFAATAAPIRVQERVVGAIYIDGPTGRAATPREDDFLSTVAAVVAMAVRADRLERLVGTAIEVVGLAQSPARRAATDLGAVVGAASRLYGPVAEARGLAVEARVPEGLHVLGDEVLLSRALDRIVEAALVSAKSGLRIIAERRDGLARVTVSRGGPAINEALARELVAPEGPVGDLKSAHGRLSDGALALARAAVARSGGRLLLEGAAPPLTASYVLELPLAPG